MGTELYVVSKSDSVYQVALPGNLTGWISENGVFQLGAGETIKRSSAEIFTQACSKFRGTSHLRGGLSFLGIDGAGMLYAAAKINGVRLPRDFEGQYANGEFIEGELDMLEVGDVLFFSRDGQSMRINASGVYTGDRKFIHANQHTGKVQYEDIADPYYRQRLLGVRRYF
jgi:cell wall-associated NlpC family hydrolase